MEAVAEAVLEDGMVVAVGLLQTVTFSHAEIMKKNLVKSLEDNKSIFSSCFLSFLKKAASMYIKI